MSLLLRRARSPAWLRQFARRTEPPCVAARHRLLATTADVPRRRQRNETAQERTKKKLPKGVPSFQEFLRTSSKTATGHGHHGDDGDDGVTAPVNAQYQSAVHGQGGRNKFTIETYGCQMNVSDTEIISSILEGAGYEQTADSAEADVVLLNTCAVRDNAERRVWGKLHQMRSDDSKARPPRQRVVGVLGCMAERLKDELLVDKKLVQLVAGPDAYRDLPRLLAIVNASGGHEQAINVQLSQDETYADVAPVRRSADNRVSAFVSIMRGCNNMCTYCIVPFTRGRERSRDVGSIVEEVRTLSEQGVKEVWLLGQNVNSYFDRTTESSWVPYGADGVGGGYSTAAGFTNLFKSRGGEGVRFAELLDRVSAVDPEIRVRFTSPHPKDFPDDVLHLIAQRPNICSQLHMPAQSGSSEVLKRMRRGYSGDAYLDLAQRARAIIPDLALSSDFIAGFCGETEADHEATLALVRAVQYEQAFLFAYSQRAKTAAHRRYADDVPEDVKLRRLQELIAAFRDGAQARNDAVRVGSEQLVLVEGPSRRSTEEDPRLTGRTDGNQRVVFDDHPIPSSHGGGGGGMALVGEGGEAADGGAAVARAVPGDYVRVRIDSAGVTTLQATAVGRTTLAAFHANKQHQQPVEQRGDSSACGAQVTEATA